MATVSIILVEGETQTVLEVIIGLELDRIGLGITNAIIQKLLELKREHQEKRVILLIE